MTDETFLTNKRQRKMTNLNVTETSGVDAPAHLVKGWAIIKAQAATDPAKAFEDAIRAMMEAYKLTRAQAVSDLAEQQPDLVEKAQSALNARPVAGDAAAVTKAGEQPQSAEEKIMAVATRLFVEGRAKSIPAGVELACKLHPELGEVAMTDAVNPGAHFVGE